MSMYICIYVYMTPQQPQTLIPSTKEGSTSCWVSVATYSCIKGDAICNHLRIVQGSGRRRESCT